MEEGNLLHKSNEKGKTMDPTTAIAAANAASSIAGAFKSGNSSKNAFKTWAKQFQLQKAWEKEKMQSAHQWEVQDLLNAGLNPVLSANDGAMNASAPNPSLPDYSTYENAKTQKLATAINLMNAYTQAKAQKSQADLNEATTTKTQAETGMIEPKAMTEIKHLNSATAVNKAQKNLIESQIGKTGAETEKTQEETKKTQEETKKTQEETKKTKGGWLANFLGTEDTENKKKSFALGAASIFGGGTAIKALRTYKALKNTLGFSKFIKGL